MSDHTTGRADVLTIALLQIRNLKGQKNDVISTIVKLEFGDRALGETSKIECSSDKETEIDYKTTLNIVTDDPLFLDDLANKPVICTIVEVLPKDKKQKDEKSVNLGQCSIDLLPLFSGELKHKLTVPINSVPGSPLESLSPEQPKPEIDILLSLSEPLLTEAQLESSNIASVTLGSLFSPPESWTLANSAGYTYIAALSMPMSTEKDNLTVFAGGQLRPGTDKEVPNRRRKWAVPGAAQGNAAFIGDKLLSSDPLEDETGELKSKEDQEFRQNSELTKLRVTWNIERRSYIDAAGIKSLREKIAKYRYWPVEVFRTVAVGGAVKGKAGDEGVTFHGLAYVDMSPLIYPGVKRVNGVFEVKAFNGHEMNEKTGRGYSVAEDAARIATSILTRNSSPGPKQTKAADPGKAPVKAPKPPSVAKTGNPDEPVPVNPEDIQYTDSKSYMMIEICLSEPLVRKRQPEELARQIAEYVPPRPLFPRRTNCAEKAVEEFQGQVTSIATKLLDELREQFGESAVTGFCRPSAQVDSVEEKRQKLIYHLNTSGKYVAFKEQLKYSVVKIVREKFMRTANFRDNNELQAFLSELYVYLVDEMHVGLNRTLSVEDQPHVPEPLTDSVQLKHFAREAEVNGRIDLAARFYQERIARDKNDADAWLDYGTFNLYINDLTKAEECFKECIAIDQCHLHGLLLNGVVCTMQDKNETAEMFFETAVTYDPQSILAWTMFGLFYGTIGNEIGSEMALNEANKLNMAAAVALAKAMKEEEAAREAAEHPQQSVGEDSLEESKGGAPVAAVPPAGDDIPNAQPSRQQSAASRKPPSAVPPKKAGNAGKGTKESILAAAAEQEVSPPEPPPIVPCETIYMQIIDFLLDVKAMPFTERALSHHLLDPIGGASSRYHIALAQLYLQKHQMDCAEQEIQAAVQVDFQNPDAWAIMGHIKYLCGDSESAKNNYERTLSFIADPSEMHSIYLRLASIYLQECQFQKARDTFLMACRKSPSCVSWLGVGIACYRMDELCDSEAALTEANILNNLDPEVWAYLCLICLRSGRQVEAEQAYKYTVKLNLEDQELLCEIHDLQEKVGFGNPSF